MSVLRDVALILLAVEGAILTLAVLAMLGLVNYGLFRFRWWRTLPRWFARARDYVYLGQGVVERGCRAMVAPIFALASARARLSGALRGPKRRRTD